MRRLSGPLVGVILVVGMPGCASRQPVQTVRIPPLIDLKQHELIGVVEFTSESGGELSSLATRKFTESARRDQGLVRILELPSGTLPSVGPGQWDPEALRALGRKHGLRTILAGALTVSKIRPNVQVSAILRSGQVSALVDATLEVQMIETSTGASIWSRSASARKSVGHVTVFGGKDFVFDAEDPERAYGDLVNILVERVTRDFRATWERR